MSSDEVKDLVKWGGISSLSFAREILSHYPEALRKLYNGPADKRQLATAFYYNDNIIFGFYRRTLRGKAPTPDIIEMLFKESIGVGGINSLAKYGEYCDSLNKKSDSNAGQGEGRDGGKPTSQPSK